VLREGRLVRRAAEVAAGDRLRVLLGEGSVEARAEAAGGGGDPLAFGAGVGPAGGVDRGGGGC